MARGKQYLYVGPLCLDPLWDIAAARSAGMTSSTKRHKSPIANSSRRKAYRACFENVALGLFLSTLDKLTNIKACRHEAEQDWVRQVALELSIDGPQKPLWHAFVETLQALSDELTPTDCGTNSPSTEIAPSLPELLRSQHRRLAFKCRTMRDLIENLELLYRSLTPRQRGRADRLLRPLVKKIGSEEPVGALLPQSRPIPAVLLVPPKGCWERT